MGRVATGERRLGRIEVRSRLFEGRLGAARAVEVLGPSPRQGHRLSRTFREDGAPGLRHEALGGPSSHRLRTGDATGRVPGEGCARGPCNGHGVAIASGVAGPGTIPGARLGEGPSA